MNPIARLYRSTIGKKVIMAVTGLIMVGWLLAHLAGNSLMFLGPEWMDSYAEHIHNLGPALWVMRIGMLLVIAAHIWSAIQVTRISYAARDTAYKAGRKTNRATIASRLMRVGGIVILAYLIFHLGDLTLGWFNPDFQTGPHGAKLAYNNLAASMTRPAVLALYMVGVTFVGLHFAHGIQSAIQTLGGNHPKWNAIRRIASVGFALLLVGGNVAILIYAAYIGFQTPAGA